MHRIYKTSKPAVAALLLLLAILALAACGGSSTGSTVASSSTGSTNQAPGGAGGAGGGRFAAVRECLQKNGITLPRRTPGQGPPQGGGLLGGGGKPPLPSGVSQAQYEAALKKCGGGTFRGGGGGVNGAAFKQALPKFAACMRENGVNLPVPNTSGNGPVFNTKGLNMASAQFKSAQAKCQPILTAARGQGGSAPGAPGA